MNACSPNYVPNVWALHKYMIAAAAKRAVFGKYDCVSFVFEALREGWDRDYVSLLDYDGRRSAVDRLRGAGGIHDGICEHLGEDLPMCDLDAGDVAWLPPGNIGLIMPEYIAVKYRRTILRVPLSEARSGWKTKPVGIVNRLRARLGWWR